MQNHKKYNKKIQNYQQNRFAVIQYSTINPNIYISSILMIYMKNQIINFLPGPQFQNQNRINHLKYQRKFLKTRENQQINVMKREVIKTQTKIQIIIAKRIYQKAKEVLVNNQLFNFLKNQIIIILKIRNRWKNKNLIKVVILKKAILKINNFILIFTLLMNLKKPKISKNIILIII
ncbi:hypothetical protein IMG5_100960 [Ichthyophthirius multifiliis]|uniref:Transmembrane protein n=1 Tax=Ichthyophthirius multifiliis TaxID=5932 RepID=G0QSG4_ICHMU|nr:hypothetical protein IMG5_100960 [Ichthyophthirius multifiliis]EGR31843.1 hypothetical protein IMG5_100960 [Ichthyophthirius multifiliis]|eukprot:XP_004035329.1 hypothetical protein IMG5_100960 [Ichthyophthirius multifiliis]